MPDSKRAEISELITTHYRDFGPTLACEKLLEIHGIQVGTETARQIMMDAGLWETRT